MRFRPLLLAAVAAVLGALLVRHRSLAAARRDRAALPTVPATAVAPEPPPSRRVALAAAAMALTRQRVAYDPAYRKIPHPDGDVPADRGVCTDVVIRAYRAVDVDLQKEVHEDMARNFDAYPKLWGLRRPDSNIDHRGVPNLMAFFARRGASVPVTSKPEDYLPGDVVAWDLGRGLTHTGIVVGPGCIVHNIGAGQVAENRLLDWKVIGHYRWTGPTP